MGNTPLAGHAVLVVDDEPLIALDIVDCFRTAGASVVVAHKLEDGLRLAGHPDLSAAVLNIGLRDGEGTALCECLDERGIPFVLHTGYSHIPANACTNGAVIRKPALPGELVRTVASQLRQAAGPR